MTTEFEFDRDTALEPAGDGSFTAVVSDRWNTLVGPDGGYVLAIATRALQHTLRLPDPLVTSAHFVRPVQPGDVSITTETIKLGRRHATGTARLSQDGKPRLIATATFCDLSATHGGELSLAAPPDLPAPEDALNPMDAMDTSAASIAERVDYRLGRLPGWVRGAPSGDPSIELWMRFTDGRPPDPLGLLFLVDAAPPAVLEIGELGSSTVEITVHVRARPAPGWLACRLQTKHLTGGYHEEDMDIWDCEGILVAQSRQLALLA